MADDYQPGERVEVNVAAGILPGANPTPDWQTGTVVERLDSGMYRVRLDLPIAGRTAEKETAPEHVRAAGAQT
jgi:ribosomal protein L21E